MSLRGAKRRSNLGRAALRRACAARPRLLRRFAPRNDMRAAATSQPFGGLVSDGDRGRLRHGAGPSCSVIRQRWRSRPRCRRRRMRANTASPGRPNRSRRVPRHEPMRALASVPSATRKKTARHRSGRERKVRVDLGHGDPTERRGCWGSAIRRTPLWHPERPITCEPDHRLRKNFRGTDRGCSWRCGPSPRRSPWPPCGGRRCRARRAPAPGRRPCPARGTACP